MPVRKRSHALWMALFFEEYVKIDCTCFKQTLADFPRLRWHGFMSVSVPIDTPEDLLRRIYGYEAFRGLQRDVIDDVLAGRDALAVLPTGGGKSLTLYMKDVCVGGITLLIIPHLFRVSSNKGLSFSFTPNTQTTLCTTASRPLLASRKGGEQTKQINNQSFRGRQIRQGGLQSRVAVGEVGRQSDHRQGGGRVAPYAAAEDSAANTKAENQATINN